jgi:hypothetical protein
MIIAISNSIGSLKSGGKNAKAKNLVKAFKARVLSDGGTFEAESCLVEQIKNLL